MSLFEYCIAGWWLNQPIPKIGGRQIGSSPQVGMKFFKKYLSCRHLDSHGLIVD